jgi:hypothetical protein
MCGRGPMNDALGALERLFRHSDNARDQWFTKMVTGAEILGGVPQPQTGVLHQTFVRSHSTTPEQGTFSSKW